MYALYGNTLKQRTLLRVSKVLGNTQVILYKALLLCNMSFINTDIKGSC